MDKRRVLEESVLQVHPDPSTNQPYTALFMRTFIHEHLALLVEI
jgi:hypothetical protein